MRALTLWPEWLPAFRHMGKTIENRGWAPPASLLGQRFALHAGANIGGGSRRKGLKWLEETALEAGWAVGSFREDDVSHLLMDGPDGQGITSRIETGMILGTARLDQWTRGAHELGYKWAIPGKVHWMLSGFRWLDEGVPCRGSQGLWNVPPDIAAQVAAGGGS